MGGLSAREGGRRRRASPRFGARRRRAALAATFALCTSVAGAGRAAERTPAQTERCGFVAASGMVNPLGMRAFVSVHREDDDAVFVYERLPMLAGDARVTVAVQRRLTVYGLGVDAARAWLRDHDEYFDELLGYESEIGYARVDETLSCE